MPTVDLGLAGLPECDPIPYIDALEREGWSVAMAMVTPGPRDIAKLYDCKRRAFGLAFNIALAPVGYLVVRGTAEELADWLEENRPEFLTEVPPTDSISIGADTLRTMREYAADPSAEARWWALCEECEDGSLGLGVVQGDA